MLQSHNNGRCQRETDSQGHLPFLVDKLDAASADTGVVEGFVWGPLRAAHTTNIRFRHKHTEGI